MMDRWIIHGWACSRELGPNALWWNTYAPLLEDTEFLGFKHEIRDLNNISLIHDIGACSLYYRPALRSSCPSSMHHAAAPAIPTDIVENMIRFGLDVGIRSFDKD
jgi:hypothetical protein